MANYKVAFVGAGIIGSGLASNAILKDMEVSIFALNKEEEKQIHITLEQIFDIMIEAGATSKAEVDEKKAKEIYESMGKVPVVCQKEINGFIVNRLSWAALDAAKESVADGVCSVEDMDKAIMYGPGLRMAVTGQILTISLGVQGGYREAAKKYGKEPDPVDLILADGVDEQIKNRAPEEGQTVEEVIRWRDKMFVKILKLFGKF